MANGKRRREKGKGSIYQRGERWYYENRTRGITPTSLKTTDKSTALDKARKRFGYLEYEAEQEMQEEIMRQYDATREKLKEAQRGKRSRVKLADAMDQYETHLLIVSKKGKRHADATDRKPLATGTVKTTRSNYRRFLEWQRSAHPDLEYMDQVSPAIAQGFFVNQRENNTPASTFNRRLADLRVIWRRLSVAAGIESNPFESVESLSASAVNEEAIGHKAFTLDELKVMQDMAAGWIRPAIFIAYYTGLRLGDVVTLEWEGVDDQEGFIRTTSRKGSKDQLIYAPEAMVHLQAWKPASVKEAEKHPAAADYVFPELASAYLGIDRKANRSLASERFSRFLRNDCKFTETRRDGRTVLGFHSLRTTAATYTRKGGAAIEQVQKRLGHSSAATTNGYIHDDEDQRRQELIAQHVPMPLIEDTQADKPECMSPLQKLAAIKAVIQAKAGRKSKLEAEILALIG